MAVETAVGRERKDTSKQQLDSSCAINGGSLGWIGPHTLSASHCFPSERKPIFSRALCAPLIRAGAYSSALVCHNSEQSESSVKSRAEKATSPSITISPSFLTKARYTGSCTHTHAHNGTSHTTRHLTVHAPPHLIVSVAVELHKRACTLSEVLLVSKLIGGECRDLPEHRTRCVCVCVCVSMNVVQSIKIEG